MQRLTMKNNKENLNYVDVTYPTCFCIIFGYGFMQRKSPHQI